MKLKKQQLNQEDEVTELALIERVAKVFISWFSTEAKVNYLQNLTNCEKTFFKYYKWSKTMLEKMYC